MDQDSNTPPARISGKFQPKSSTRRSRNEREQEEQAEAERQRQRQIDRAAEAKKATEAKTAAEIQRHRGVRQRTRGNRQSRGGLSSWRNAEQTGFLGAAISGIPAETDVIPDDLSDSEPVARLPARARQQPSKPSAKDKKNKVAIEDEPAALQIKDEEERATIAFENEISNAKHGINIDDLAYNNLISDEEADEKNGFIPRKGLYPIRLKRKSDGNKAAVPKDDDSKSSEQMQQEAMAGVASASEHRKITSEDDELKVTKTVDVGKRRTRSRRSHASEIKEEENKKPDISARGSVHARNSGARDYVNVSDDEVMEDIDIQPQMLKRKQTLFSKPVLQTAEDHEEWERHQADMRAIAEELGPDDDDVAEQSNTAVGEQKEAIGRRDEQVYVLQLPPAIPKLLAPSGMALDEPMKGVHNSSAVDKGKNPVDTQGGTQEAPVKIEDETVAIDTAELSKIELPLNASSKSEFKGPIGTLTVYKSGDTVLSWGGIEFQMERGMSSMLQETLLVDDESSVAYSMSQVAATFVVKPNWDALLEARE